MIRDIQLIDDDIIRKKRIVEKMLYSDPDIVELINNDKIDPESPEDLVFENIFPFIRIPSTQDESKTFITFSIDDDGRRANNQVMKSQSVTFVIFVHKDIIKTGYGISRHDAIGYVIRDIFNLSNVLGPQMELESNREGVPDVNYVTRTLRFQLIDDNSTKPLRTNPYEYGRIVGHRG